MGHGAGIVRFAEPDESIRAVAALRQSVGDYWRCEGAAFGAHNNIWEWVKEQLT
jgi:hypothetical protein